VLSNYYLQDRLPDEALSHIPGSDGWPVIGNALEFLRDPLAYARDVLQRYGPVSRGNFLFERRLNLVSADANEFVLLDRAGNFSAHLGWQPVLGQLFPRGLMLRDGNDHRYHRRLMQPAFRREALAAYLARMQPRIAEAVARWTGTGALRFYPEIKHLTLDIASDVFLGLELRAELDQVGRDFSAVVQASAAVNRLPWIGRMYARGQAGRRHLEQFIRARIGARRAAPGTDLFSQLCLATDEEGRRYSDDEIVDHLIFVMMAAHDTTTSALTTIVYALGKHPQWQSRLRDLVQSVGGPELAYADLAQLEPIDLVLREALRLYPPLTVILRRTVRACEFQGWSIPSGTSVAVYPVATQRQEEWWTDPDAFDPERFSPERAEHRRHPFAWAPFGGGAHMCLGLHFAEMQVKAVMHALLRSARIEIADGYRMPYQLAPIARPRDGLPLQLRPVA
jgi:cytochrome P450